MVRWSRASTVLTLVAAAAVWPAAGAWAQIGQPGPVGNSTGIGSGLGGVVGGTGPGYPNGTGPPALAKPPPPGGQPLPTIAPMRSPTPLAARPSTYPQPRDPYGAPPPGHAADVPPGAGAALALPASPSEDFTFLKGCWRSEVFSHADHAGTTTWCFRNGGASGRFLYARLDQPEFFCHAAAEAHWQATHLLLHSQDPSCSDGSSLTSGDLDCGTRGAVAECRGSEDVVVRLYRVR